MSRSDAVSVPLLTTSALYCALTIPRGIIPPLKRHRPDACDEAVFFFFFLCVQVCKNEVAVRQGIGVARFGIGRSTVSSVQCVHAPWDCVASNAGGLQA